MTPRPGFAGRNSPQATLLSAASPLILSSMRAVTVREAEGKLGQLIAEACRGELILLTDGDRQVSLEPRGSLDLEQDTPDLEAELLRAVNGPHRPFSERDLRELADKALAEYRARPRR